jgi:hypothetical protein
VARLIYAFLALSLGTLVAGFLIRDSSVPLFVSIGLSALVLLLILVGTSRRLRRANALEDEQADLAELEIVEIDADESVATDAVTEVVGQKRRPPRRRRTATVEADTQSMDAVEELLADEPDDTEFVAPPRTRRKPAARPRPARRRVASEPGPDEAERALEIDEIVAMPTDEPTPETVAESEPPLTIEMPPPSKAAARRTARPRRPARAARDSEPTTTDAPVAKPASLSPKVWVIPGRSRYHALDCRFAKGEALREVTQATAERRGYVACNVCKPGG